MGANCLRACRFERGSQKEGKSENMGVDSVVLSAVPFRAHLHSEGENAGWGCRQWGVIRILEKTQLVYVCQQSEKRLKTTRPKGNQEPTFTTVSFSKARVEQAS